MKEIELDSLLLNPFAEFGDHWMALAAGTKEAGYNAMTVAWGHMGSLWERDNHANRLPTAICYVRPERYTKEFMDREPYFRFVLFQRNIKKPLVILAPIRGRTVIRTKQQG